VFIYVISVITSYLYNIVVLDGFNKLLYKKSANTGAFGIGGTMESKLSEGNSILSEGNYILSERNYILSEGNYILSEGNYELSEGNYELSERNYILAERKTILSEGNYILAEGNSKLIVSSFILGCLCCIMAYFPIFYNDFKSEINCSTMASGVAQEVTNLTAD
jgi:hypothetical protein